MLTIRVLDTDNRQPHLYLFLKKERIIERKQLAAIAPQHIASVLLI